MKLTGVHYELQIIYDSKCKHKGLDVHAAPIYYTQKTELCH